MCLELALARVLGQPQRFLRRRVRLRPAPCERLCERKPGTGDRQTSDRPDRAGAVDDPRVESQCGRVVADVEAGASGRQHQVDVVELVLGDRKRVADRGDAGAAVAREVTREPDEQTDEESVVLVVADVER